MVEVRVAAFSKLSLVRAVGETVRLADQFDVRLGMIGLDARGKLLLANHDIVRKSYDNASIYVMRSTIYG